MLIISFLRQWNSILVGLEIIHWVFWVFYLYWEFPLVEKIWAGQEKNSPKSGKNREMYFVLEKLEILNKSEGNCKWRLEAATLACIVYLFDWGNFIFISWETILQNDVCSNHGRCDCSTNILLFIMLSSFVIWQARTSEKKKFLYSTCPGDIRRIFWQPWGKSKHLCVATIYPWRNLHK